MHASLHLRRHLGAGLLAAVVLVALLALGTSRTKPVLAGDMAMDAVPGQIIVRYAPSTSASRQDAIAESSNARGVRDMRLPHTELVKVPAGTSVQEAITALERQPGVLSAEPNYRLHAFRRPSDTLFDQEWGLDNTGQSVGKQPGTVDADIDAPEAWDMMTGSANVVVGVLDTGVAYDHPDLQGQIAVNPGESGDGKETDGIDNDGDGFVDDWRGWDFAEDDNDPYDLNNHGTHVSGTIGARGDDATGVTGVNWNAAILPIRFLDGNGMGTMADLVDALAYIGKLHIPIVNGSFGGPPSPASEAAIKAATDTLFVFAAGNDAMNNDLSPGYPCSYDAANIICVAATDQNDRLADFSNYGRRTVDLAAPGVDILSSIAHTEDGAPGGYDYYSGTSMATPHVAGVAALALSFAPGLSVDELKAAVLAGVDPVPTLKGVVLTGGRVNAERTLLATYVQVNGGSTLRYDRAAKHYVARVHVSLKSACAAPCSLDTVELRAQTRGSGPVVLGRLDGLQLQPGAEADVDVPVSAKALLRTRFAKRGSFLQAETSVIATVASQGRTFDPSYVGSLAVSTRSIRNGDFPGLRPMLPR